MPVPVIIFLVIAWFSVTPNISSSAVQANISEQGYVAGRDRTSFVSFPSIGVNDGGKGVIAYSLMGDRYHPSAAQTGIKAFGSPTQPLKTSDGQTLGSLCVYDLRPREFDEDALQILTDLADIVMDELELRLASRRALFER